MTFSLNLFTRIATPTKAARAARAAIAAQPAPRVPLELQPQQLSQVAGGAPRGGWLSSTPDAPRGGWL